MSSINVIDTKLFEISTYTNYRRIEFLFLGPMREFLRQVLKIKLLRYDFMLGHFFYENFRKILFLLL